MQVSILAGILIILAVFSFPFIIVYSVIRFMKWQEWRNHDPVVKTKNIYDENGNLIRQETYVDGVPRILIGKLEEGF